MHRIPSDLRRYSARLPLVGNGSKRLSCCRSGCFQRPSSCVNGCPADGVGCCLARRSPAIRLARPLLEVNEFGEVRQAERLAGEDGLVDRIRSVGGQA